MKKIFLEYAEVIVAIVCSLIGMNILIIVFKSLKYISLIKEGVYGL